MPDWSEVLPVLQAISRLSGPSNDDVEGEDLARELGRDANDMWLYNLLTRDLKDVYVTMILTGGMSPPSMMRLTIEGRQHVERWPSPGAVSNAQAELLLAALDARIAETTDEDERGRLGRLRDSAGSVGVDVLSGVISAWLGRVSGITP
jgi:hypothetical protein